MSAFLILAAYLVSPSCGLLTLSEAQLHSYVYGQYSRECLEVYCWAQNTYFVPFDRHVIPQEVAERERREVSYYQWCPFFLVASAFAFYFPCILWRVLNDKSGPPLHSSQASSSRTDCSVGEKLAQMSFYSFIYILDLNRIIIENLELGNSVDILSFTVHSS